MSTLQMLVIAMNVLLHGNTLLMVLLDSWSTGLVASGVCWLFEHEVNRDALITIVPNIDVMSFWFMWMLCL